MKPLQVGPFVGWVASAALLAVLSPLLTAQSLPAAPPVLIENGTLIDGSGRPAQPGMSILIEGGRIQKIARRAELAPPPGVRVISAAGKFIIPGLIDSHVHYDMPWLHRLYLANGITTVRDLGTAIERTLTLRQELNLGNILGPRMFVSGMPINPGGIRAMGAKSAGEMAQMLVKLGVDGIKATGYTPEDMRQVSSVAHQAGLIVYGHTGPKKNRTGPGARLAVEAGLDGVEHALGVLEDSMDRDPDVPAEFDATKRDHLFKYWYGRMHRNVNKGTMHDVLMLMVQHNTYFSPTLVNFDRNFAKRNTPELENDPALRYIPEDEPDAFGPFTAADREEWQKTLVLMREATRDFSQAGGLLIAGTDSPGAALPGWSLHQEMEQFVMAGVPAMKALQAATINNARIMNKEKDLGSVEAGKLGDVLILNADPMADIRNTQKIHLVVKEGRVLDPAELLRDNLAQFGERGKRTFDRKERH